MQTSKCIFFIFWGVLLPDWHIVVIQKIVQQWLALIICTRSSRMMAKHKNWHETTRHNQAVLFIRQKENRIKSNLSAIHL